SSPFSSRELSTFPGQVHIDPTSHAIARMTGRKLYHLTIDRNAPPKTWQASQRTRSAQGGRQTTLTLIQSTTINLRGVSEDTDSCEWSNVVEPDKSQAVAEAVPSYIQRRSLSPSVPAT
ncbi:hypothetical protein, partial [uncultured Sphingomonas sp.]|uniref:hypothetical protein n=1 Tax=uncultured Sphingomonas sp. TaxID=158754 RepID=UPI0035CC186C